MRSKKIIMYGVYKSKCNQLCMTDTPRHYQQLILKDKIVQVEDVDVEQLNADNIKFVCFRYSKYDDYMYIPTEVFKKCFKLIDDTNSNRIENIDDYIE